MSDAEKEVIGLLLAGIIVFLFIGIYEIFKENFTKTTNQRWEQMLITNNLAYYTNTPTGQVKFQLKNCGCE